MPLIKSLSDITNLGKIDQKIAKLIVVLASAEKINDMCKNGVSSLKVFLNSNPYLINLVAIPKQFLGYFPPVGMNTSGMIVSSDNRWEDINELTKHQRPLEQILSNGEIPESIKECCDEDYKQDNILAIGTQEATEIDLHHHSCYCLLENDSHLMPKRLNWTKNIVVVFPRIDACHAIIMRDIDRAKLWVLHINPGQYHIYTRLAQAQMNKVDVIVFDPKHKFHQDEFEYIVNAKKFPRYASSILNTLAIK